jgi:hypothetical protein
MMWTVAEARCADHGVQEGEGAREAVHTVGRVCGVSMSGQKFRGCGRCSGQDDTTALRNEQDG